MSKISQDVNGSGNQSCGTADSIHQTNDDHSINLQVHLSLPHNYKLFSVQFTRIHITLEDHEEKP